MYWFGRMPEASSSASSMPHDPSQSRMGWVSFTRWSLACSIVLIMFPPGTGVRHSTRMRNGTIGNWVWRGVAIAASALALILALRVLQSQRQPDLEPWHTRAPREADAAEIDELDWPAWLAREDALMNAMRAHLRGS